MLSCHICSSVLESFASRPNLFFLHPSLLRNVQQGQERRGWSACPEAKSSLILEAVQAVCPEPLVPVAALLGKWVGEGKGFYPTINPFSFREVGSPVFS
jgi:hypothetical protein